MNMSQEIFNPPNLNENKMYNIPDQVSFKINDISNVISLINKTDITEMADGTLIDNYLLFNDNNLTINGHSDYNFIVLDEYIINGWESGYIVTLTNDFTIVDLFIERHQGLE